MLTKISLHRLFSLLWTKTGHCQQSWAYSKEMLQTSFSFYFEWPAIGVLQINLDTFWAQ